MDIGKIHIDKPLALAPMENVTDLPFRLVCKELGADIVYTEFVNTEGLVRNSDKTKLKMNFIEEERPFGIQLYGGNPDTMYRAAAMAAELQPDIIDINCGCWVKNVVKNGAGSDLLRDLPRMENIIKAVVSATNIPVTVKTRLGWDSDNICILDIAKIVEQAGAQALTIHCRTRAQAHQGDPDFSWIAKVKQIISIPVIANGSIDTPVKVKKIFDETECDGIMIGRGAIYNPWIFRQTKDYLQREKEALEPNFEERLRVLLRHLHLSVQIKGERRGVIEFRKHYSGYLKGFPNVAKIRQEAMQYTELEPLVELLMSYKETVSKSNRQYIPII